MRFEEVHYLARVQRFVIFVYLVSTNIGTFEHLKSIPRDIETVKPLDDSNGSGDHIRGDAMEFLKQPLVEHNGSR